ncbi:MAG: hypothetical protein QM765_13465 [Myxococcales bacterium]
MFCPKCGDSMTDTGNGLECRRGRMPLSQRLERRLRAAYEAGEAKKLQPAPTPTFEVGGTWHCPACGAAVDPDLVCSTCKKSLRPFIYELVELHPHQKTGHSP